jgi:hypothetical protein
VAGSEERFCRSHPRAVVVGSHRAFANAAKARRVSGHVRIESPVKGVKLKFLDAATLLDEQEKSFGLFEQIILRSATR